MHSFSGAKARFSLARPPAALAQIRIPLPVRLWFVFLVLILAAGPAAAQLQRFTEPPSPEATDYLEAVNVFYTTECPLCYGPLLNYLFGLQLRYPGLSINAFEIKVPSEQPAAKESENNLRLLEDFARHYNSTNRGSPRTFVGTRAFVGYEAGNGELIYSPVHRAHTGFRNQIELAADELARRLGIERAPGAELPGRAEEAQPEGPAPLLRYVLLLPPLVYLGVFALLRRRWRGRVEARRAWLGGLAAVIVVCLFLWMLTLPVGRITSAARGLPFPLFVGIIALADGFNPCAFTVFLILLSLLTYTRRRRETWLVGGTFVAASGIVYFAFIVLLIVVGSVFLERYGGIVLRILGAAVLVGGLLNLKDFFFLGKGVSLSLSAAQKARFAARSRRIVLSLRDSRSWGAMLLALGGTVLLALGVNIVELGCTAILPTVYMSLLLARYGLQIAAPHYAWTALYALLYVLPLAGILVGFTLSLKSGRLSETQGRWLKLAGGLFMLAFGAVMLFKPEWLALG